MTVWKSLIQLLFVLSLAGLAQGQAEGGKAHFQVHNKIQGNMVIKATKAKASVCDKKISLFLYCFFKSKYLIFRVTNQWLPLLTCPNLLTLFGKNRLRRLRSPVN